MAVPSVTHTPTNPNLLHPNKFVLTFTALPTVEYWVQSINLPGLQIGEAPRPTPFVDLYSPGDKLQLNALAFTFLVDESLSGWFEIYTWLRAMAFPANFDEYKNLDKRIAAWAAKMPQFSDAVLTVMDSKQNPKIRVKYYNCFPTTLTDLLFSAANGPNEPMTVDAHFRYDLYEIERL